MVVSCSGFGCTNRRIKGGSIQFHKFPLNNPELLKKWLIEIRRKNFMPTKYSSICSEHFKLEDYQIRPLATVKLLKTDAFPSIFKAFPSHLQKTIPVKRRKLDRIMTNDVDVKVEKQSTSSEQGTELLVENETVSVPSSSKLLNCENKSTQCELRSPTKQLLRKKIKILQQRLKRRNIKIKSLKSLIHNIKKNVPSSDEITAELEERFGIV